MCIDFKTSAVCVQTETHMMLETVTKLLHRVFLRACQHQHQRIYSCNEGNFDSWDEEIKKAVMGFKTESPPWAQRYVGSMVSDVHRTLLYGGLFLYPADKKSTKGKRLT